eukprot:scaffold29206_cov75-Phaeocystis_antarctica.AAC.1
MVVAVRAEEGSTVAGCAVVVVVAVVAAVRFENLQGFVSHYAWKVGREERAAVDHHVAKVLDDGGLQIVELGALPHIRISHWAQCSGVRCRRSLHSSVTEPECGPRVQFNKTRQKSPQIGSVRLAVVGSRRLEVPRSRVQHHDIRYSSHPLVTAGKESGRALWVLVQRCPHVKAHADLIVSRAQHEITEAVPRLAVVGTVSMREEVKIVRGIARG